MTSFKSAVRTDFTTKLVKEDGNSGTLQLPPECQSLNCQSIKQFLSTCLYSGSLYSGTQLWKLITSLSLSLKFQHLYSGTLQL